MPKYVDDEQIIEPPPDILAVHMIMDSSAGQPWGDAKRGSKMVFIGRDLDIPALQSGFAACKA